MRLLKPRCGHAYQTDTWTGKPDNLHRLLLPRPHQMSCRTFLNDFQTLPSTPLFVRPQINLLVVSRPLVLILLQIPPSLSRSTSTPTPTTTATIPILPNRDLNPLLSKRATQFRTLYHTREFLRAKNLERPGEDRCEDGRGAGVEGCTAAATRGDARGVGGGRG